MYCRSNMVENMYQVIFSGNYDYFLLDSFQILFKKYLNLIIAVPVADPGFPVGGHPPHRGAPTPDTPMFQKTCMSK